MSTDYDRFKFKRSLSHREIVECEWALKPKCVCRCAGEFHGARRLPENAGVWQYEALPTTDPHRLQPKPEREADAKIRRYHRRYHARAYDHWTHPEQNLAHPIRRAFINGVGTPVEWCPICLIEGRAKQVAE